MFDFFKANYKSKLLDPARKDGIPIQPKMGGDIIVCDNDKLHASNEFKGYDPFTYNHVFDLFSSSGLYQVNMWQAIRYYENIAPVGTAIDMITDEASSIEPRYFDGDNFSDSPALDILRNPNADQEFTDFFKAYSAFYKITGNSFVLATGRINKPPLELAVIPPQFVSVQEATDGYAGSYHITVGKGISETFNRIEQNGRFRFVNKDGTREIWHVKQFNASADNFMGKPILQPIYYEIEQYLQASEHNLSLLQKGGRLSGALISKGPLTEQQFQRAQEQVDNLYAGARNAGRIMIGEGDMKFEEMSSNMRDMDFRNLKKDDMITIYNRLRIPLPLISPDHMTMSNYEQARLALYDNAVLPDAKKLYKELSLFLAPRYGWNLNEGQQLTYDESTVQALQLRRNEEVKLRKEINVNKVDELRRLLGDNELDGGSGDTLLVPVNVRDIDEEPQTDINGNSMPQQEDQEPTEDDKARFKMILQSQQDAKGNRIFSDEEIESMAKEQGML